MTHQSHVEQVPVAVEAGRQVARLRSVLLLVEEMAGAPADAAHQETVLDESARLSSAYGLALPVVQRRFDALAAETAAWAANAVDALLAAQQAGGIPRVAAARLAAELDLALAELNRLVRA